MMGKRKRATPAGQLTIDHMRAEGFMIGGVERILAGIKHDLFGFIDYVAIRPGVIVGIQTTSLTNMRARERKLQTECREACLAWLNAGGEIQLHGWGKEPGGAKYELTLTEYGPADFRQPDMVKPPF